MESGDSSPTSDVRSDMSSTMGRAPSPRMARFAFLPFFDFVKCVDDWAFTAAADVSGIGIVIGGGGSGLIAIGGDLV
jgi:hypothetical protein